MESTLRKTAPKNLEIIETLCFKPDEGFIRLPGHIDRLEATCSKLRYSFDRGAVLMALGQAVGNEPLRVCLLYTSPSPRDQRGSRMPSSA